MVRSPQPIPAESPPLRRRIQAFLWDYLVILVYLSVLVGVGAYLTLGPDAEQWRPLFADPVRADAIAFGLTVVPVVAYFALCESSASGATFGKRRMGIRVLRADGEPLSAGRALLRAIFKFVPWQVAHTGIFHTVHTAQPREVSGALAEVSRALIPGEWAAGLIGLAWLLAGLYLASMWLNPLRRATYDRLAGTWVTFVVP